MPSRNDSPSGAATTTRALELLLARLRLRRCCSEPTSAAWSPSRSATSACARSDSVPGMENELERLSPDDDRAERGGGEHQQPRDEHDPAVAVASPAQTVQHACHVHSLVDGAGYPTGVGYLSVASWAG